MHPPRRGVCMSVFTHVCVCVCVFGALLLLLFVTCLPRPPCTSCVFFVALSEEWSWPRLERACVCAWRVLFCLWACVCGAATVRDDDSTPAPLLKQMHDLRLFRASDCALVDCVSLRRYARAGLPVWCVRRTVKPHQLPLASVILSVSDGVVFWVEMRRV